MSDTAAAQFRRLLDALPRFAEQPTQSLAALSDVLGVEAATLVRDFGALAERYDDPAGFVEGVAVNIDGDQVTVRTDHFCRPMRLTHSELCALELGLALLARESPSAATPHILALRDRLATLITILPQDRVYAGYRDGALATGGRDLLDIVRQALRRRRVLRIGYQGAQQDAASNRDVHPWRLVFSQGAWYLVGWCEANAAPRVFRVDRITFATLLERGAERPDDSAIAEVMVDGQPFVGSRTPEQFTVRYSPTIARWVAERDRGPLEPDGSALRTRPLADREWAIRHVLQYGPDAEIVAPRSLRAELLERLRAMGPRLPGAPRE